MLIVACDPEEVENATPYWTIQSLCEKYVKNCANMGFVCDKVIWSNLCVSVIFRWGASLMNMIERLL